MFPFPSHEKGYPAHFHFRKVLYIRTYHEHIYKFPFPLVPYGPLPFLMNLLPFVCQCAFDKTEGLRIYSTGRISEAEPQDDVPEAKWQKTTPEAVAEFSAVGYGFGLELQKALDVPVGLIQAAFGGTLLEGWVSPDAINNGEKAKNLQRSVGMINKAKGKWAGKQSHLWNANIHPILNVRIAGTIWYQGCSNVRINPVSYKETLIGLIASWRKEFNNPEMPFYIAQIAPHTYEDLQGAQLRESQNYVAARVPGCELVVTNDSQEIPGDIHPRLKKNVCHRFAQCALGQHYGKEVGEWRSPAYAKREVKGSEMVVRFKNLPTTLKVEGEKIIGFQLGEKIAGGRGAGANPEIGQKAAAFLIQRLEGFDGEARTERLSCTLVPD